MSTVGNPAAAPDAPTSRGPRFIHVRFNELPRAVRERFVRVTSTGHAMLLALEPLPRGRWLAVTALMASSAACIGLGAFFAEEARVKAPQYDLEMYALFALCAFVAIAAALGHVFRKLWPGAPYRDALYVFRSCAVKTAGDALTIIPFQTMRPPAVRVRLSANSDHNAAHVDIDGNPLLSITHLEVPAAKRQAKEIIDARDAFAHALAASDRAALSEMDPFLECTLSGRWSWAEPGAPTAVLVPRSARFARWLGALFGACLLAWAAYAASGAAYAAHRAAAHGGRPRAPNGL